MDLPVSTRAAPSADLWGTSSRPTSLSNPVPRLRGPLVLTADPHLVGEVQRLCAAADVHPQVVADAEQARAMWWQAPCVIVGPDQADSVSDRTQIRRDDVWLVTTSQPSQQLWQQGVAVKADAVLTLPADAARLVDLLADMADAADGAAVRGRVVGVVAGCGGAGASTVAAGLALQGLRSSSTGAARASAPADGSGHVLLVDADWLGGGLELLMGCESAEGVRWPEVASTQGRVAAAALRDALLNADGVALLTFDPVAFTVVQPEVMRSMLDAGRRASGLVVVDLPRALDPSAREAVTRCDVVVVLGTGDVRAAAGIERVLGTVSPLCADVRLVVRRTSGADLSPDELAASVQLTLAGEVGTYRTLARAVNEGLGPGRSGRFARQCRRILDGLGTPVAARPGRS